MKDTNAKKPGSHVSLLYGLAVICYLGYQLWDHKGRSYFSKGADNPSSVQDRCLAQIQAELAAAHMIGQVRFWRTIEEGKGREKAAVVQFNIHEGQAPENPPVDRDNYYQRSAFCYVDKYSVTNINYLTASADSPITP